MGIERMHSPKYRRDRAEELRAKTNNCAYAERGMLFAPLLRATTISRGAPRKFDVPLKLA
ncbi:hypothetical protein ACVWZZ_002344 [Bradyrhizobium sp. LM6.10]|jgi:hypothetical protein